MAIVFVSPREKRKLLFWVIGSFLLVFILVAVTFVFVLPEIRNRLSGILLVEKPPETPDIRINFDILDSDKFKNLEPFEDIKTEFDYVVQDKKNNQISGKISIIYREMAVNPKEAARSILEKSGFKVLSLEGESIGRKEPFASYEVNKNK